MSSGIPNKPIDAYPVADLGDLPIPPMPPEAPAGTAPAPAVPAPAADLAEAAVLTFLDPAAVRATVPLQFPFKLPDRVVRTIEVRRLNGAEVGRIANERGEAVELYDFYAAMSGLPKAVLRGLIDDDLEAFLEKARPFLCRFARDVFLSPIGESGAASPGVPDAPSAIPGPVS